MYCTVEASYREARSIARPLREQSYLIGYLFRPYSVDLSIHQRWPNDEGTTALQSLALTHSSADHSSQF